MQLLGNSKKNRYFRLRYIKVMTSRKAPRRRCVSKLNKQDPTEYVRPLCSPSCCSRTSLFILKCIMLHVCRGYLNQSIQIKVPRKYAQPEVSSPDKLLFTGNRNFKIFRSKGAVSVVKWNIYILHFGFYDSNI